MESGFEAQKPHGVIPLGFVSVTGSANGGRGSDRLLEEVCEKIKTKIGRLRENWNLPVRPFLDAFYRAQRGLLENVCSSASDGTGGSGRGQPANRRRTACRRRPIERRRFMQPQAFAWGTVNTGGKNPGSGNWSVTSKKDKNKDGSTSFYYHFDVRGSFGGVLPVVVVSGSRVTDPAVADASQDNTFSVRVKDSNTFEVHSFDVADGTHKGTRQAAGFSFIAIWAPPPAK